MVVIFIHTSRKKDYCMNTNDAGKAESHLQAGCFSKRQITTCVTQDLTQVLRE
jgi:hypothetical protein